MSALSLNENTVWVVVEPNENGGPATVRFEPSSSGIVLGSLVTALVTLSILWVFLRHVRPAPRDEG
mgnify:CR=1 FL=1